MKILATFLFVMAAKIAFTQPGNYLNFNNNFPKNSKEAKNEYIYNDGVKLAYENTLLISSTGGGNKVNETILRNEDSYVKYDIFDADVEMKFSFEKGASPESAVGMEFTTHRGSRLISYRFLMGADGHFYSNIDSADYSEYKNDLRQFTAKTVTPKLLMDGAENKLEIKRHAKQWKIYANGVLVDSIRDTRYLPFNPANGIRFIFSGKFTMQLNSLQEDYALFQNKTFDYLEKLNQIAGNGYVIVDLNTAGNTVVDNNATLNFEMAMGNIQAKIISPALGGVVNIYLTRNSDGTYEKSELKSMMGEYEIVEFTLDPETKNWYLKAETKSGSYEKKESDFYTTETVTTTTSTLWYRGTKQ